MLDVVLVSRGREDFLAMSLSCLFAQEDVPGLRIQLFRHEEDPKDTYLLEQMKRLAEALGKNIDIIQDTVTKERSLASIRATGINRSCGSRVFMMDNDCWFSPGTLSRLFSYPMGSKTLSIGFPAVDIDNARGYPDFSHKVYLNREEYEKEFGVGTGVNYHMFREVLKTQYCTTYALWNRGALIDSGVLDFWKNYPVGERFYDYLGSKMAVEKGYECILLPCLGKEKQAFWHLWTKKDDKGFFDKKGLFNNDPLKNGLPEQTDAPPEFLEVLDKNWQDLLA